MPIADMITLADFSVGGKCDTILTEPPFTSVVSAIVNKALFDPEVRAAWGNTKVAYMYARATTWNVIFAAWKIEEHAKKTKASIIFRPIEGANHFVRVSRLIISTAHQDCSVDVGGSGQGHGGGYWLHQGLKGAEGRSALNSGVKSTVVAGIFLTQQTSPIRLSSCAISPSLGSSSPKVLNVISV